MKENYLFLGNPGTGKSTLINCLVGQQAFESGLSYGTGMTRCFQTYTHQGKVYMDTPGFADLKVKKQAAVAITEALRQSGTYKLFFTVRLENGRVVSDDLATIETVMNSIDMDDVPFSIVVNNVKERQYKAMLKKGSEFFKVATLINSFKYATPYITFIPTLESLDERDNQCTELPRDVIEFFRDMAPSVVIPSKCVNAIMIEDFRTLASVLHDKLEKLRSDNAALRRRVEELTSKPRFFETLLKVSGVAISALIVFLADNAVNLASLLSGDVTGALAIALNLFGQLCG